ncbi:MAG: CheR family methyltransferase [Caulobacterales bacterium]|jgi:two-component system CheB/CheR fusion protein
MNTIPLVVGIGASAGGLEAFRAFFSAMPTDTGMAFVLVQHLDPDRSSALVDILRGSTAMAVSSAEHGAPIAPNRVFVIPPDAILRIEAGVLQVTRPATAAARRAAIDTFLTSLAEDQGEDAVGIILSGFGADGALGVEAIKEQGGLTLAQAEFDHAPKPGMPQSAAARGYVDHVLAAAAMPKALIDHLRYRSKTDGAKGPDGLRADVGDHLGAICAVLSSRLGRDFSQYKTNTLMRRIQRRMQVLQVDSVPAYLEQLRERPDEPELLFREVLIRVTRFFRDPAAFGALSGRIPDMLAHGDPQDTIRIWVPGCATGEEAYSLAILFKEAMARAARPRKVQIFATDIDDQAIEVARAGLYAETIAADLSEDLLDRHFLKEGDRRRVSKEIRQMCLFSVHDLVKDPPFSRLDLVSCRNLLIYFGPALQKRVIAMFHYGLLPGGLLLLGSSEAVTAHTKLFAPLDKKHRLFERKDAPAQLLAATRPPPARAPEAPARVAEGHAEPQIARIMARYAPAFVVIDRRQNVQQFSGPIAKYLEPAIGSAGLNLPGLIHPDLRAALRGALKEAMATARRVILDGLTLEISGRREAVNLIVEPLAPPDADDRSFIVAFQDLGAARPPESAGGPSANGSDPAVADEAVAARERLQTLTEELETSNEELQSSNEEYQSVNEELQSANEELETSKEELQSINEELATVNTELNSRNESLVDLNSDLANLIDSTSIATLFLDRELRIKRFTPTMLDIFNVRTGDEGRPITDIVSHLARDGLQRDVQQVIRTLVPVEREVALAEGDRIYQMQVRPYRDINDVINGVVITFVDVSIRKRHEIDRAKLAAIVESSDDAIFGHDLEGRVTSWNAGAQAIYGYAADEMIGQPMATLLSDAQAGEWPALLQQLVAGVPIHHFDSTRVAKDGRLVNVALTLSPIKDSGGGIIGVSAVGRDITASKLADAALRESDERYRTLFHAIDQGFCVIEKVETPAGKPSDFRYVVANPAFAAQTGVGDVVGKTIREAFPGEPQDWFDIYDTVLKTGEPIRFERDLVTQGRCLELYAFPVGHAANRHLAVLFADVTARKRAERRTGLLLGELDHRVKNILAIVSSVVSQTLKTGTPAEFAASVEGRIKAIAKAHSLLTAGGEAGVSLDAIVKTELAPYQGSTGRVTITGDDVTLTPMVAMPVAMAIQELATNAAKYGALSSAPGRLLVSWAVEGSGEVRTLKLAWTESGGPPVNPDPNRGFGTSLIERALAYQFNATVDRAFAIGGVTCKIAIPFTEAVGQVGGRNQKGSDRP